MIAYLEGTILNIRKDRVILKCGPVGFEVFLLNTSQYQPDQALSVFTYQQFREDGQSLFGFEQQEQLELFTLLLGVKGLGCKSVMNAMSRISVQDLISAIERADAAALKKLPGIGARTAGQIILDLKGKLALPADQPKEEKPVPQGAWAEVELALESLGYKSAQIAQAKAALKDSMDLGVDQLLRLALREVSSRRNF